MIKVLVVKGKRKKIKGFVVEGHAYYDEPGRDVVCAAVSAIAYNAVASLLNLAGGCQYEDKTGYLEVFAKESKSPKKNQVAKIILESTKIGFKQIENSYGEYIEVYEKEV